MLENFMPGDRSESHQGEGLRSDMATPRNLLSRVSTARTVFSKSRVLPIVSLFDTRHHFPGQRNDTSADAGIGPLEGLGESALWSGNLRD